MSFNYLISLIPSDLSKHIYTYIYLECPSMVDEIPTNWQRDDTYYKGVLMFLRGDFLFPISVGKTTGKSLQFHCLCSSSLEMNTGFGRLEA